MTRIKVIEELEPTISFKGEEHARSWLFEYLRKNLGWFCYKIEDVGMSNKPFDSIIDTGNNHTYLVEFKFDRHKKFDKDNLKATTKKQLEPMQMVTLISLKNIGTTVYVITYVKVIKKFIIFTY